MAVRGKRHEAQVAFLPEIFRPGQVADEEYLDRAEGKIRGLGKLVASGMVEIGRELIGVKERVGYQGMIDFATKRLRWSQRSTDRFVAVATMFSTANLAVEELTIDASSLYLLAQPSTPEEARTAVLERAASPNGISRDEVAALIEQAMQQAAAKATADAQQNSAAELAKASKATEAAIAKLNKAEVAAADLKTKLAELRASRTEALTKARAEVAERYKDKLIITEDELRDQVALLTKPTERKIVRLEKSLETANARRQRSQEEIDRLRARLKSGAPKEKPFDSNLSMKAMSVEQAIEHLRGELKLSPAECIAIEQEMATRIHQRPALANEKLSRMAGSIADIMPWFEKFLELQTAGAQG